MLNRIGRVTSRNSDGFLRAYESMAALREGIKDYFLFYNTKRTHQSLAKQTPDEVYFKDNGLKEAA